MKIAEDSVLDLEYKRPKKTWIQWVQYLVIVSWVSTNLFLMLSYQIDASGVLITTCPNEAGCPPPQTPFMDNCWKYLLVTNVIGLLLLYGLRRKIKTRR